MSREGKDGVDPTHPSTLKLSLRLVLTRSATADGDGTHQGTIGYASELETALGGVRRAKVFSFIVMSSRQPMSRLVMIESSKEICATRRIWDR